MKPLCWALAIVLAGWVSPACAQLGVFRRHRDPLSGSGPAPLSQAAPYYQGFGGYRYYTRYVPYTAEGFSSRLPSYPQSSSLYRGSRQGAQTSYFRAPPGAYAAPRGTFFGGYDYKITYPPDWYGGYWTW
jgi:hypothetical protein